jgi:prepilin-type N-terminal cleavage/methylation domain-containing protein
MIGNTLKSKQITCLKPQPTREVRLGIYGGFTLVELVLVLMILAIMASAAVSMVHTQVDQVKFEQSQQTLNDIEYAVLGSDHARAADGSKAVSGFVADCGRLPYLLENLYLRPTTIPEFGSQAPAGDSEVTVTGGWNGPYLQLAMGASSLPDGWASTLAAHESNGDVSSTTDPLSIVRSLGRDQAVGGTNYDKDLSVVFEADADAVTSGLAMQAENRWQKSLTVYVYYNNSSTDPEVANGEKIVIRVYGPVADPSTGDVTLGTIQQEIVDYTSETSVSKTFSELPIGPRIIRAYQLNAAPDPEDDLLATNSGEPGETLEAVSVQTRVVVSRETSSIQLILKDK